MTHIGSSTSAPTLGHISDPLSELQPAPHHHAELASMSELLVTTPARSPEHFVWDVIARLGKDYGGGFAGQVLAVAVNTVSPIKVPVRLAGFVGGAVTDYVWGQNHSADRSVVQALFAGLPQLHGVNIASKQSILGGLESAAGAVNSTKFSWPARGVMAVAEQVKKLPMNAMLVPTLPDLTGVAIATTNEASSPQRPSETVISRRAA